MTGVEDFVSRRTTAPCIMLSQLRAHGTRPNTTVALVDITGLPLKRERRYSRTTARQLLLYTTVNVDGVAMYLEVSIDAFSDSEIQRQRMPTSTLGILIVLKYTTPVILVTLLALSALKIELSDPFATVTNFVAVLLSAVSVLIVSTCE